MSKIKKGEQEAFEIVESVIGISMDKEYHDDNSESKMPDFKTEDGTFIEVTNTYHNHNKTNLNKFDKKSSEEKLKILTKASTAQERITNLDYERTADGELTPEAKKLFIKDVKAIKDTFGFDYSKGEYIKEHEWCDCPIAELSADNILKEIEDKSDNYSERFQNTQEKISLFVFATKEEIEEVEFLYKQRQINGASMAFLRQMLSSIFKTVYICEYDLNNQEYDTTSPKIIVLDKIGETQLNYKTIN